MDNQINDSAQVNSGRDIDYRKNVWTSIDAAKAAITGEQRQEGMFIPVRLSSGIAYPHHWVNGELVPFNPRINQPNGVVVDGFTLNEAKTEVTMDGTEWVIHDIPWMLQNVWKFPVPAPDPTGLIRIDRIKLNSSPFPEYMVGEAGISAVAKPLIFGEILLRDITVSLADTTSEPEPVVTSDNQIHYVLAVPDSSFGKIGDVAKIVQAGADYGKEYKKHPSGWVLEYTPTAGGPGGSSTFSDLTDSPYDNSLLAAALNDLDADIITAQDTANIAQDGVDALELSKVDKIAGKSLLSDTEIARLLTLANVDITGKVDKVAGKSLLSDTEITRLLTLTNTHLEAYSFAVSDETTALTAGVAKISFRMPYAFTLQSIRASLNVAATGSNFITNIRQNGTTIFSTNLSIDATELTSTTAATPAVISNPNLLDDALIEVDFVQVGATIAGKGHKISFIGYKP